MKVSVQRTYNLGTPQNANQLKFLVRQCFLSPRFCGLNQRNANLWYLLPSWNGDAYHSAIVTSFTILLLEYWYRQAMSMIIDLVYDWSQSNLLLYRYMFRCLINYDQIYISFLGSIYLPVCLCVFAWHREYFKTISIIF